LEYTANNGKTTWKSYNYSQPIERIERGLKNLVKKLTNLTLLSIL
jgi:hypothetical protein